MKGFIPLIHSKMASLITEVKKVSKYITTTGSTSDNPRYSSIATPGNLFQDGNNIRTIDLTNILSVEFNSLSNAFSGCSSLTTIIGISEINTSKVTNMNNMFNGTRITDFSFINNWSVPKLTNVSGMFANTALESITLPDWFKNSTITNVSSLFSGCTNLKEVYNFDWSTHFNLNGSNSTYPKTVFDDCKSLETIEVVNMDYTSILGTQHGGNPVNTDYWVYQAWALFQQLEKLKNITFTGTVTLYSKVKELRFFLNCNVSNFTLQTWQSFVDTLPSTTDSYRIKVNKGLATIPSSIVSQITAKGYTLTT